MATTLKCPYCNMTLYPHAQPEKFGQHIQQCSQQATQIQKKEQERRKLDEEWAEQVKTETEAANEIMKFYEVGCYSCGTRSDPCIWEWKGPLRPYKKIRTWINWDQSLCNSCSLKDEFRS
eukprot:TRINITY_DN10708_c0_g1_i1.p1 TRINITY_DN10708_c0_g1~~TRINITY_DN10708_c0_g1_i1.p1  ORF type:complete len:120 (-),score=17.44 TRINITY_DN10708_c0_g1_i1:43-402(-)